MSKWLRVSLWVVFGLAIAGVVVAPWETADQLTAAGALVVLWLRLDSRWLFGAALVLLVSIPVNQALLAPAGLIDGTAVYVFYLLSLGVGQSIIELRWPKPVKVAPAAEPRLADLPMLAPPAPAPARYFDVAPGQKRKKPVTPPEVHALDEITPRGAGKWLQPGVIYRVVIFPVLVTGISTVALLGLSPVVQPYLDDLYARPVALAFINKLHPPTPVVASANVTAAAPKATSGPALTAQAKAALKVKALNGDSKLGSATKLAAALRAGGFTVGAADIGNAKSFDYTQATVFAASDQVARAVVAALAPAPVKIFPALDDQGGYDAIVVSGSKP